MMNEMTCDDLQWCHTFQSNVDLFSLSRFGIQSAISIPDMQEMDNYPDIYGILPKRIIFQEMEKKIKIESEVLLSRGP